MPFHHQKAAYPFREFLRIVSISKGTGVKEIRAGRLRVKHVGKKVLITAQAVDDWLEYRETKVAEGVDARNAITPAHKSDPARVQH